LVATLPPTFGVPEPLPGTVAVVAVLGIPKEALAVFGGPQLWTRMEAPPQILLALQVGSTSGMVGAI